jgi:hypothetical protein
MVGIVSNGQPVVLPLMGSLRRPEFKGFAAKHIFIDEILLINGEDSINGVKYINEMLLINEVKSINEMLLINVEYMIINYSIEFAWDNVSWCR